MSWLNMGDEAFLRGGRPAGPVIGLPGGCCEPTDCMCASFGWPLWVGGRPIFRERFAREYGFSIVPTLLSWLPVPEWAVPWNPAKSAFKFWFEF